MSVPLLVGGIGVSAVVLKVPLPEVIAVDIKSEGIYDNMQMLIRLLSAYSQPKPFG